MADYTTTELLRNLKRRGFIPSGSGLTTNDLLAVLTEQLGTYIPAFLKGIREEFIIASLNLTVTAPAVPIPPRACGAALRTIGWLRPDNSVKPLTRIEPERRDAWGVTGTEPEGFMFVGNDAVLIPAVSSGTLVVTYQERPGQLVLPDACALISGYDDPSTIIVSNLPSTITVGAVVDIVKGTPNFDLSVMDGVVGTITDLGGGDFSLTIVAYPDELPTGLTAGYVCLAGETCIPRLPMECFNLLAQAAAYQLAAAQGNERLPSIKDALMEVRSQLSMVLAPRADGSARIIVSGSRLGRRYW